MPTFKMRLGKTRITLPVILAIANTLLRRINFVEHMDATFPEQGGHQNVTLGILAKAVILSTFVTAKSKHTSPPKEKEGKVSLRE